MQRLSPYLIAARPHQWLKNLLIFAAPLAAGEIDNGSILIRTSGAAFLFLLVSVSVYFFNDLCDIEADKQHTQKAQRPIANGEVSVQFLVGIISVFSITSLTLGFLLSPGLGICLGVYIFVNFLYSIKLKEVPYIELILVASGFVLRAAAGGMPTNIPLSFWFITLVSSTSFFLVAGKRFAELSTYQTHMSRLVLKFYSLKILETLMALSSSLAVITYGFWLGQSGNTQTSYSLVSLFLFTLALLRYRLRLQTGFGEDPVHTVLSDFWLLVLSVLWALTYGVAIYG